MNKNISCQKRIESFAKISAILLSILCEISLFFNNNLLNLFNLIFSFILIVALFSERKKNLLIIGTGHIIFTKIMFFAEKIFYDDYIIFELISTIVYALLMVMLVMRKFFITNTYIYIEKKVQKYIFCILITVIIIMTLLCWRYDLPFIIHSKTHMNTNYFYYFVRFFVDLLIPINLLFVINILISEN